MRWLFVLAAVLAILLAESAARANCTPGELDYHEVSPPAGATGVPTNTHVLLRTHGSARFVASLPSLWLEGPSGARIALRAVLDLPARGFMQQRTVALAPARTLAPRTVYTVRGALRTGATPTFTTGAGPDGSSPTARGFAASAFEETELGCGPAHVIPVRASHAADDATPLDQLWARVRVARSAEDLAAGRAEADFVVPLDAGAFQLGHEMCIGNFALHAGETWYATITLLDEALHEGPTCRVLTLDAS